MVDGFPCDGPSHGLSEVWLLRWRQSDSCTEGQDQVKVKGRDDPLSCCLLRHCRNFVLRAPEREMFTKQHLRDLNEKKIYDLNAVQREAIHFNVSYWLSLSSLNFKIGFF